MSSPPEFDLVDMRKTILHALTCASSSSSAFLVVFILPAWEDLPWRIHFILHHPNLTILAHLSANQLKFFPAHKQLDNDLNIPAIKPSDWSVDLIIIANEEERQAFLHHDRLHRILIIPGLQ